MKMRLAGLRAGPLVLLAILCTLLLLTSTLLKLAPVGVGPVWIFLALALAFVPALLARGSPLPATLGVLVPVLMASSYGASRLEWLRTLKEFHLMEEAVVLPRLLLGVAALLVAWGVHVLDTAFRLRWRAAERGIMPAQGRLAMRVGLRRGGLHAAFALGGTVVLGALTIGSALVGPSVLPVERMAFLAPLLAALLLVAAALLLVGVQKKGEPSADEAEQVRL